MKVRFDSLNRFEVPKFYVCNPGSIYSNGLLTKIIGCLSDTSDEELVLNFNATSELNFRAYKTTREDPEENNYVRNLYRSLQNRRLVYVDSVGFFVISQVDEASSEQGRYKDIRAESCEIEIAQKALTYIEDGTYKFIDLLEQIVATLPMWLIGHIDDSVKEKYRTFESVSTELNTLEFFMENMQDAYECIFQFDIVKREINVYDQNNFVRQTPILFTGNDLVNSIEITESSDDLYTAISVFGANNLGISAVNPLGSNTIYDFSYYLSWMSPGLRAKVISWSRLVDEKKEPYLDLSRSYHTKLTEQSAHKYEMDALEQQATMYRRMRDNIVAENSTSNVAEYNAAIVESGGTGVSIQEDVDATLAEVDSKIAEVQSKYDAEKAGYQEASASLEATDASMKEIHDSVAIESYFSIEEYGELYNYIFEGSYTDEYITITDIMTHEEQFEQMKTLYDRAIIQLEKISQPTQEFTVDVENFIFQKEFEQWSEQLETGTLIHVELDTNDIAPLFLSNITINYHDRALNLTFGNRYKKFDPKSMFDNVLGDIQKTANTIEYIKDLLYPVANGEFNSMKEALQNSRNLTMAAALASTNEEVIIDGSGYTGRRRLDSGEYDPRQIKITGRSIVFTDDAWESAKVAIGEIILDDDTTVYGINAKVIMGDIILGNELHIIDDQGRDIFTVIDDRVEANVSSFKISVENKLSGQEASSIVTETGYTFGADGLIISKSDEELTNRLDNTGMYVDYNNENILTANDKGVNAINLHARQYLICGDNSRFENYYTRKVYESGHVEITMNRTGCFYIGE